MRILYWTDWFLPSIGGVEVFSARLVPALAERINDRGRGTPSRGTPPPDEFRGVTVQRFPFHQALAIGDLEAMSLTADGFRS